MMNAGNFIIKHSKRLLENKQYAVLCAVILAIMPFASWLSAALVLLVTLRKGARSGFEVMLPAVIMHSVPLAIMMPLTGALVNSLIAYVPCYIAALSLRKTTSWQAVFAVFFIQALIGLTLIHLVIPDFIVGQFNHFKNILIEYKEYQQLVESDPDGLTSFILAQLFFGIQILSVVVSAMISLLFARSIQSKLFMPGGFRDEILEFRSGRLSFLVLIAISMASYYEIPMAINLLPFTLCYFLISGFSLAYHVLARKNPVRVAVLLFLLVLFKPSFVLLAYIVLGSLDSLFNFRLYLPEKKVRESV